MIDHILLAVDGSGRSREQLNMLLPLPSFARAQVTVLHVVPLAASAEGLTEYRLAGERILDKEAKNLRLQPENRAVTLLKEGDPKDVVCRVAEELKPNLLIMGSRGMGRLQAILANSVSQYVFQIASVPMLLVKDDIYIKSIRSLMVAIDGSSAAKDCLNFAVQLLQGSSEIEILLVRVVRKAEEGEPTTDPALLEARGTLTRLGIKHRIFWRVGESGREICAAATEANASLLLLGSPDRRPEIARSLPDLDRLLGGSVSDYVRVNAPCPVLLTRSPVA
ncbi:MAG: universal stress protein [Oscillatoriales cyanobacterium SM2_2_1]|nr:universal stress protein [Oscillatoriales cyanobacterium SM2_2_1]